MVIISDMQLIALFQKQLITAQKPFFSSKGLKFGNFFWFAKILVKSYPKTTKNIEPKLVALKNVNFTSVMASYMLARVWRTLIINISKITSI